MLVKRWSSSSWALEAKALVSCGLLQCPLYTAQELSTLTTKYYTAVVTKGHFCRMACTGIVSNPWPSGASGWPQESLGEDW